MLVASWGQVDPQAAALLAKMRAAYGSLKSARGTVQTKFLSRGKGLLLSSKVEFKAPMNFRMETSGVPGTTKPTYVFLTDGKKLYTDGLPGGSETKVYSYQALLQRLLPQSNLETLCFFDWRIQLSTSAGGNMHRSKFKVLKKRWGNRDWTVLEESPITTPQVIDYYVDPSTYLIWRTAAFNSFDKSPFNDFWFTKLQVNPTIDPKDFRIP